MKWLFALLFFWFLGQVVYIMVVEHRWDEVAVLWLMVIGSQFQVQDLREDVKKLKGEVI